MKIEVNTDAKRRITVAPNSGLSGGYLLRVVDMVDGDAIVSVLSCEEAAEIARGLTAPPEPKVGDEVPSFSSAYTRTIIEVTPLGYYVTVDSDDGTLSVYSREDLAKVGL